MLSSTPLEYRLATHFRSGEVCHTLEKTGLRVHFQKTGREVFVPFDSVREINLRNEMADVYSVRVRHDHGTLTIPSRHFVGVGRFESRAPDYRAFVAALSAACAASGRTRFIAGSSILFAVGVVTLVMGALLAVGFIAGLAMGKGNPQWRVLFVIPVALAVGVGFLRQGAARSYDPASPPAHLLPP